MSMTPSHRAFLHQVVSRYVMLPLSSFLDVLREYAKRAYPDHVSFLVLPEGCGSGSYERWRILDYSHGETERDKQYA